MVSNDDNDDMVTAKVQIYGMRTEKEFESFKTFRSDLPIKTTIISVYVGVPGLYLPRHDEYVHQVPFDLIQVNEEPTIGKIMEIKLPRWVADRKGILYHVEKNLQASEVSEASQITEVPQDETGSATAQPAGDYQI